MKSLIQNSLRLGENLQATEASNATHKNRANHQRFSLLFLRKNIIHHSKENFNRKLKKNEWIFFKTPFSVEKAQKIAMAAPPHAQKPHRAKEK